MSYRKSVQGKIVSNKASLAFAGEFSWFINRTMVGMLKSDERRATIISDIAEKAFSNPPLLLN